MVVLAGGCVFEVLTVPARQALVAATETARAMGSRELEAAHFLLGLLDAPGAAQPLVARFLPDRAAVVAEVARVALPSRDGARPGFGEEVALALAAARGISLGRGAPWVGTATCLLGVLTMASHSVDELLRRCGVDIAAFRDAAAEVDDAGEAAASTAGAGPPWAVMIGGTGPYAWNDQRG